MRTVWHWMLLIGCLGLFISLALLAGMERPRSKIVAPPTTAQVASGQEALPSAARKGASLSPATVGLEDTVGFLVKFGLVLLLLYGSLRVLRGVTLRWRGFAPSAAQIAVLETRYLSPRRALYLVRAGSRVLLLGGTDQQISFLADVTDEGFEDVGTGEGLASPEDARFQVPLKRGASRL